MASLGKRRSISAVDKPTKRGRVAVCNPSPIPTLPKRPSRAVASASRKLVVAAAEQGARRHQRAAANRKPRSSLAVAELNPVLQAAAAPVPTASVATAAAAGAAATLVAAAPLGHSLENLLTNSLALERAVSHLQRVEPKFAPLVAAQGMPHKLLAKVGSCFGSLAKCFRYHYFSYGLVACLSARRMVNLGGWEVVKVECGLHTAANVPHVQRMAWHGPPTGLIAQASYIIGLAESFASGALQDDSIRAMDDAALLASLSALNGVGPWTVDMFAMFHLGRPDILPVGDLAVRKGVAAMYGLGHLPGPAEMQRVTQAWRPFRSVGTFYMWGMPEASARIKKPPAGSRDAPKRPGGRTGKARKEPIGVTAGAAAAGEAEPPVVSQE